MNGKIKTSIQYQLTNVWLFDNIYRDWDNFKKHLNEGTEHMKEYLLNQWNEVKSRMITNENIIITDLDTEVTKDSFKATFNKTANNTLLFFFTFPTNTGIEGACKYIALAITPKMPRYYTLEFGTSMDGTPAFFLGEWVINAESRKEQRNFGKAPNDNIGGFAGYITKMLESENL